MRMYKKAESRARPRWWWHGSFRGAADNRICLRRPAGPQHEGEACVHAFERPLRTAVTAGFTMIEVLIVVVILAIAAAVAVPMMSSAGSTQVRAAASMVAADLEYAKSMAISRGQNYSVVFDEANETYQIEDQTGTVIQHPVKKGFNYMVDFPNDSRLNRVVIVDADFDGTSTVSFDYLGSPYDGGSPAAPLNSGVITLQAGGVTKTISVEPVTGFITVN